VSSLADADQADRYLEPQEYEAPDEIGYACIPVLEFLNGLPWDNMALCYAHAMRPSEIRVIRPNHKQTTEAIRQRLTVHLDYDYRTILKIEQEVEVGLIGVEHGHALHCELDSRKTWRKK
jgi:hypothetical protein